MSASARSPRIVKLGLVVLIILALAGAYHVGLFARFAEPKALSSQRMG